MQEIYYLICRGIHTQRGLRISHVMRVYETTLDHLDAIYTSEVAPLYNQNIYDVHTMILERPANLDFLKQLAQAPASKEE